MVAMERGDLLLADALTQSAVTQYRTSVADFRAYSEAYPEEALGYDSHALALLRLGDAEHAWGDDPRRSYREAIISLGEVLKRAGPSADPYRNRGIAYAAVGRAAQSLCADAQQEFERAAEDFERAIIANPEDADARYCVAEVYAALLSFDSASSEHASRMRSRTIVHVRRAVELGWVSKGQLASNPNFRPLQADPEWMEFLRDAGE